MSLSLKMIREATAAARRHAIPPLTVKSRAQAKSMTSSDPAGRHWRVGEAYFLIEVK